MEDMRFFISIEGVTRVESGLYIFGHLGEELFAHGSIVWRLHGV
jgi:hypothetical protein